MTTCDKPGCNNLLGLVSYWHWRRRFCSKQCRHDYKQSTFFNKLWQRFSWLRLGHARPSASTKASPDIRTGFPAGARIKNF